MTSTLPFPSFMKTPLLLTALSLAVHLMPCAAQEKAAPAAEYFPDDSRRLSQVSKAVVLDRLLEGGACFRSHHRQAAEGKVEAHSLHDRGDEGHGAVDLRLHQSCRLLNCRSPERGWHAVYVGLCTTSGGFDIGGNGIRARLSDEPVSSASRTTSRCWRTAAPSSRRCFLTVADLKGQSVEIAPHARPARHGLLRRSWCR